LIHYKAKTGSPNEVR